MSAPEAFLLLTLSDVDLTSSGVHERGTLALECVTVPSHPSDRDVFLVLRLNTFETVVDPIRQITVHTEPAGDRVYTLHRTAAEPNELVLRARSDVKGSHRGADLDTFDGILGQYADFTPCAGHLEPAQDGTTYALSDANEDLRGRLVLVDETNGEVLGTVGENTHIHQDFTVAQKAHEHDPVIIDVGPDGDMDAKELFVHAIAPGEHNFITRGASVLSTGITRGATLLATGMTSASNYYVSRATPHPSASPSNDPAAPHVPPPKVITWMNSSDGRRQLTTANQYTGKAVQVSGKTIALVEKFISRTMTAVYDSTAGSKGKRRVPPAPPARGEKPSVVTASPEPLMFDPNYPSSEKFASSPVGEGRSPSVYSPPPYSAGGGAPPPLPARKGPDGTLMPRSAPESRAVSPGGSQQITGPPRKLNNKDRIALSANLLMASVDKAIDTVVVAGSSSINTAVGHKYGAEAARSSAILTCAARNVGLVYVDVTGLGRKALLKSVGKHYIKAHIRGRKMHLKTDAQGQVVEVEPIKA